MSDARTLFGFPYPLLFCLMISFILLPMQLIWYNASAEQSEQLYLQEQQHRHLHPRFLNDRLHDAPGADHASFRKLQQPRDSNEQPAPTATNTNVDAVVFVALGPAATAPVLGWSVHSLVRVGGWHGQVYVLTDEPEAVEHTLVPADTTPSPDSLQPEHLHIVHMKPEDLDMPVSLHSFNAKLIKCRILHILPETLQNIVYIDSDIITGQSLDPFWESLSQIWQGPQDTTTAQEEEELMDDDVSLHDYRARATPETTTELALFEDGKAFTAGFCLHCDTWNTGVMSLSRGRSDACLDAWCGRLAVEGGTDQAALDKVMAEGAQCQNIRSLSRGDMRMMKDIFVVLGFVGTKTFNHFTGVFRPQNLSGMHRRFYERMLGRQLTAATRTAGENSAASSSSTRRRLRDVVNKE